MIRVATLDDVEALLAIYGPIVEETAISFETEVPSPAAMRQRLEEGLPCYPWLVAGDDHGRPQGYAYATCFNERHAYRWSVAVSVYVAASARRRRVGRLLYRALLALLEEQRFATALAIIALPNPASVGLHESLGFTRVGVYRAIGYKLGRWHDVGWWQRPLAGAGVEVSRPSPAGSVEPAEPVPFTELRAALGREGLERILKRRDP